MKVELRNPSSPEFRSHLSYKAPYRRNRDSQRVKRHSLIVSEGKVALPILLGKRKDRRLKGESASELRSKNRGKVLTYSSNLISPLLILSL